MRVSEVIAAVRQAAAAEPGEETVDTLKHGAPEEEVRGIACTFIATPAVIREAAAQGANLLITHEPTYYNHFDAFPADIPLAERKRQLLAETGMTVWRFHDLPHIMRPDAILAGLAAALGWSQYALPEKPEVFALPPTTLGALAAAVRTGLGTGGLRWVGSPEMSVERVAVSVGCNSWDYQRSLLLYPGVQVLLCGEQREWEACEYVRDANQLGCPCGLIVAGHCNSEEAGMRYVASWIAKILPPEIPVAFIPAGDPFRYA